MGKTEQVWWPRSSQPVRLLLLLATAAALLEAPCARVLSAEKNEELVQPVLERARRKETVLLSLDAFGLQLRLKLLPDHSFLAPGFTLQTVGRRPEAKALHPEPVEDLTRCFYSGAVNRDPNSAATLNLCKGVRGVFHLQDQTFFIQPAPDNHTESLVPLEVKEEQSKRLQFHVLRRRRMGDSKSPKCPALADATRASKRSWAHRSQQGWEPGRPSQPTGTRNVRKMPVVSSLHYVETMLVADQSMAEFHGSGLRDYLLTLFSVASQIYKHPSIWNSVNLVVVKILVIYEKAKGPEVTCNGDLTVRNFCNWQQQHNPLSDQDAEHYDTAILFTRQDLCSCVTRSIVGRAFTGTMCNPRRSCSVVKDDGLRAAFTIAHELGHLFNMPHDDAVRCADFKELNPDFHIMSPLTTNLNLSQPWSLCSAYMITSFLNNGHGRCLMDKPQRPIQLPSDFPGTLYDVNQQCQFMFGEAYRHCRRTASTCKTLWCTVPFSRKRSCHTKFSPWADGTNCGDNKWCIHGECVDKTEKKLTPIHGMWGSWEPWTDCSRTCGGGVQHRTRKCDNPVPKNGGESCEGLRVGYNSCNIESCPHIKGKTFGEERCEVYNHVPMNFFGNESEIQCIPRFAGISPDNRCKFTCEIKDLGIFLIWQPMV